MEQRSAEWFEERRGKINASEAGGLLGLSPYTSAKAARRKWVREYHGDRRDFDTPDMARGRRVEPFVLEIMESRHDTVILQDGGRIHEGWLRASADGYSHRGQIGYEVKCPRRFFEPRERPDILMQLLIQCLTYGWERVFLCQGVEDEEGVLDVRDSEHTAAELREQFPTAIADLQVIWGEMQGDPVDEETFSTPAFDHASEVYLRAKADADTSKALLENARGALMDAAGNQERVGVMVRITEAERKGSLDTKKLLADHPDIDAEQYRKASSTYFTIKGN